MIFPSFLRFHLVPPKRLLVAFDFDFFTSSRCRYRCRWDRNQSPSSVYVGQSSRSLWVPSCGRLCRHPLPHNPTPPSRWCHNPPNPSPPLGSWSASVLPPAAQSPLLSSHKRKPLLCLFFTLHAVIFSPVTLIHERHLRRGLSVSVGSHWPGKERLSLWTVELWTWRHCGRSRCV